MTLAAGTLARPIRVVLVDDDPMVRTGLRSILATDATLQLAGEAGDGRQAIHAAAEALPDIMLMDIRMPVMDGIQATREIRRLPSPPEIIALTTFSIDEYVIAMLREGASGFLLKDTHPREILGAIRTVHGGNALIDPTVTRKLIRHLTDDHVSPAREAARARVSGLTATERTVLQRIANGMSNQEIASLMRLSESAVKAHINRMYPKLGVQNRVQAAIVAHEAALGVAEST